MALRHLPEIRGQMVLLASLSGQPVIGNCKLCEISYNLELYEGNHKNCFMVWEIT